MPRMRGIFAQLAAAIGEFEEVRINADEIHHAAIRAQLESAGADLQAIRLFPHPTNDVWCRDHGPSFVKQRTTGEIAVVDWQFNAWGGKFHPYDNDNAVPTRIADSLGLRRFQSQLVFEGGGLEVDGAGLVLTTESVVLNPNRNPTWSRAAVAKELCDFLGCQKVLWLRSGLEGDDTDGHIDTLTRFIAPGSVITAVEENKNDPNYPVLERNRAQLVEWGLNVIELPQPAPIAGPEGWREARLPGTYANFLILNGAVLVPTYRQADADTRALEILAQAFPGRRILGFDCLDILQEGGAIHCLTQQQPA